MHRVQRRDFLIAAGTLVAAPFAAAQQAARIARIGYLSPNLGDSPHLHEAFVQGMRELAYVEGRNVLIEYKDAAGKAERLPALAAELVARKVDVIVVGSTFAALAAKQATSTVPIVFPVAGDPVASGLVTTLARPGGNLTGLSLLAPELIGKRLELLTHAVPGLSQIAVLWEPGAFGGRGNTHRAKEAEVLKEAEVSAKALAVSLHFFDVRDPGDFDRAFSDMIAARARALSVLPSGMFIGQRRRLVDLAAKHRLPAVYQSRESVDIGGLMSYGPNLSDLFRRGAAYVVKILKGVKPGDLPVELPTQFELVINLKTAKTLGLTIPQSVLGRADEVIR